MADCSVAWLVEEPGFIFSLGESLCVSVFSSVEAALVGASSVRTLKSLYGKAVPGVWTPISMIWFCPGKTQSRTSFSNSYHLTKSLFC